MIQKNQNLKISVIVPVYNKELYLERCLDSVINQTYKNLEIICVNDGSSDNSGKILDEYAKKDDRIKVIHKENGGVSSARNKGLVVATGVFVGFIDSDDYIEPEMFEVLISGIKNDETDISICGYFDEYSNEIRPVKNILPISNEPMKMEDFHKFIYIRDKYRGVASYLWNRILRKSVIDSNNIKFDESIIAIGEDFMFLAHYYLKADKVVYNDASLYHYVQLENSKSNNIAENFVKLDWIKSYQCLVDLYEENNVDSITLDYVKRMLVYRAAWFLEKAYEYKYLSDIEEIKKYINKYLDIYIKTNQDYPERIEWVENLLKREV